MFAILLPPTGFARQQIKHKKRKKLLGIHKPTSKYIAFGKGHDYGRKIMVF
jgi:hypothetical protein